MPPQSAAPDSGTKYHHLYPQKTDHCALDGSVRSTNIFLEDTASGFGELDDENRISYEQENRKLPRSFGGD
jgi:hypothetical protein